MEDIVLYCKSYHKDLARAVKLAASIEKHNSDKIPFYVSCPSSEVSIFKKELPRFVNVISDEDIVKKTYFQDWKVQQIVKSQFWKYLDVKNYVCLDSDSFFIKDFSKSDFLVFDDVPYTVMHQQKNLFQWTARYRRELGFDPQESYNDCRTKVGQLFNRRFKLNYDFGPVPVIWSSKVWKSLEENYLQPNNLTFEQLIQYEASEFTWYGEWLLASKEIEIYPIEPMFLVFHYALQLEQFYNQGYTVEDISKCYFGIVMSSSFNAPINY